MIAVARQAAETRQTRQRDVHAERARAAFIIRHALARQRRHIFLLEQALVEQLRIDIGGDRARAQRLALLGNHADGLAALDDHLAHADARADVRTGRRRRLGHRLRDRTHAADGMAPGALDAVHFAEHVMQQHVGAAGRVRAGVIADDAVEAEHGLDRLALEETVEVFGGGNREQIEQLDAHRLVKRGQALAELAGADQLGQRLDPAARGHVRRRFEREFAQHVGDQIEAALVFGQRVGVLLGELRHFVARAAGAGQQICTVGARQEIVRFAQDDLESVLFQFEIADHLRLQQRHGVRGNRIAETRMEFLGHRRAADDVALLQHGDLQSSFGQVSCTDEAVVAAADQDHVKIGWAHAADYGERPGTAPA